MPTSAEMPLDIVVPGWGAIAWLCALAFAPLLLALGYARIAPGSASALPPALRGGIALALGLIGAVSATIGSWVISSNGAWRDEGTLHLRASRAFYIELPLEALRVAEAEPLAFDTLEPDGRLRTPGYAAGAYRDTEGRQVFVLWAGAPLTRIPTERDFDIAFSIADPEALR